MKTLLILVILFTVSCSSLVSDRYDDSNKSDDISYEIDSDVWKDAPKDHSDSAYYNPSTGTHLFINSICKKYERSSLKNLTQNILTGIKDIEISQNKVIKFQDREAIRVIGNGKLDGVRFYFNLFTLKRNRCTYDFINLSTLNDKKEKYEYEKIISSIEFED